MKHGYSISMAILTSAIALGFSCGARAQVTSNDDFTQANDTNSWTTFDGACLTAGDGTGSIPACVGLPYYNNQVQIGGSLGFLGQPTNPGTGAGQAGDAPGQGALRFTNGRPGGYNQNGAVVSNFNFPTIGHSASFTTMTYRGDSGGGGGDGADGIELLSPRRYEASRSRRLRRKPRLHLFEHQ